MDYLPASTLSLLLEAKKMVWWIARYRDGRGGMRIRLRIEEDKIEDVVDNRDWIIEAMITGGPSTECLQKVKAFFREEKQPVH